MHFQMRLDARGDRAIIKWLDMQQNKTDAVKALILADIERQAGKGTLYQVLREIKELKALVQGGLVVKPPDDPPPREYSILDEGLDSLF